MRETTIAFLETLGIVGAGESPLLDFVIQSVTQSIKNQTNQGILPKGLEAAAVYMAAGQYIGMQKGSGQLCGFDLEAAEKQIREGDTSVTFAIGEGSLTPEQRLDSLIDTLMSCAAGQVASYRRLVWE